MTLSLVFLVGLWQSSSLLSCGHVSAPYPILDSSCSKLSALCKALNPHTCRLGRWDTLQPQWSHRKELLHLPFPVHPHFSASSHTTFILNRTILSKGETLNLWSRALLSLILFSASNCIYHYTTKHQNNSVFLWRFVLLKVLLFSLYHFILTTTLES